ncbi:MAG TPA: periplasmic heavy metal sensor [Longimicrobiales bacterium]|nr:periplasmic heavy metal sensor [Longimicrobiales bacterium]
MIVALTGAALAQHSPFAGQGAREIKALSPQEVSDLLEGRGMGLAKVAELNHYPGPKHVLELARELSLSESQLAVTREIYDRMRRKAVPLGKQIVARERELEHLFGSERAQKDATRALLTEIAHLQGELRATHIEAHMETKQLLTPDQLRDYDRLRGYATNGHHSHQH